jgi:iron-sulfur cluster insertion protein
VSNVQSTEQSTAAFSISARAPEGITLSQAAARRLATLSQAEGKTLMLRVAVEGGGCSGFQYQLDLVEEAQADDIRIECDGQVALVDKVSVPLRGQLLNLGKVDQHGPLLSFI